MQIFFIYPEALFIAKFHTSNQAGTAVPGNITLEHNWFPRCFDEMRLEIGSHQLEIINEPGEFDTMLKFLTRSKDYEDANIEGWIPDTGTGNSVADLTAADEGDAVGESSSCYSSIKYSQLKYWVHET